MIRNGQAGAGIWAADPDPGICSGTEVCSGAGVGPDPGI